MSVSASSSGAPFSAVEALHDVRPGHLEQQREVAERWSEAGGLGGRVGVRVDQAQGEDPVGVGRQLAARGLAGDGVGDAVELVEQARDGVARRIEVDGVVGPVAQEQEAQQRRRQQRGDLVRRRAFPLRRAHLAPADVQELVGNVERRLALEDPAADRVGPVA